MLETLLRNREKHLHGYATKLSDDEVVPWRCLSVGEYLDYQLLLAGGKYPPGYIENEIFCKCVLDKYFINQIDKLPAGVITTVVQGIMANSAPNTTEEIELQLNQSRQKVGGIVHDLICIVCQAFPGYKPDELYAMPFELLIERVALAERKLLSTGMLKTSLELSGKPPKRLPKPQREIPRPPPVNLAQKYKEQETQTIITRSDMKEQVELAYTGHEKVDRMVKEQDLLQNTVPVYQDYLDKMQQDGKLSIKSPEVRKAEALERARVNELQYNEIMVQRARTEEEAMKKLAEHRQIKRTAKRRRR